MPFVNIWHLPHTSAPRYSRPGYANTNQEPRSSSRDTSGHRISAESSMQRDRACSFRAKCKFRHICTECSRDHAARACSVKTACVVHQANVTEPPYSVIIIIGATPPSPSSSPLHILYHLPHADACYLTLQVPHHYI